MIEDDEKRRSELLAAMRRTREEDRRPGEGFAWSDGDMLAFARQCEMTMLLSRGSDPNLPRAEFRLRAAVEFFEQDRVAIVAELDRLRSLVEGTRDRDELLGYLRRISKATGIEMPDRERCVAAMCDAIAAWKQAARELAEQRDLVVSKIPE